MAENEKSVTDFFKELKSQLDMTNLVEQVANAITQTTFYGNELNKVFGQGRQRIIELQTSIADSIPGVTRLGGSIKDVETTMAAVAEAARRNLVATSEQTEKLYAAAKVTGVAVRELADGFADVGIGVGQMTDQIQKSVLYIQSIGGNTKQVFKVVTENMDQMNRYQFEGGVQGLTKMAAQASMLRFDMRETFRLADTLYKPERAIEVASAFQRLGLAVGDLGDPFKLMNDSIMNPQGLQDSLVKMTEQFTYFDEKTKTFKITPEGVLRLKELQDQTTISASEMTKLSLAAKEADRRLSALNKVGLKISSEEDKQFLANIAQLDEKTGEYVVKLKDGTKKELAELTQPEFDKLIEQQKTGPKTLEDIARASMNYDELISADIKSILHGLMYGFATPRRGLEGVESVRRNTDVFTGEASKMFGTTKIGREMSTTAIEDLTQFVKDFKEKGLREAVASTMERVDKQAEKFGEGFKSSMVEYLNKVADKTDASKGMLDSGLKTLTETLLGDKRKVGTEAKAAEPELYTRLLGRTEPISTNYSMPSTTDLTPKVNIEFSPLNINLSGPGADKIDKNQLNSLIKDAFNKQFTQSIQSLDTQTLLQSYNKQQDLKGNNTPIYTYKTS